MKISKYHLLALILATGTSLLLIITSLLKLAGISIFETSFLIIRPLLIGMLLFTIGYMTSVIQILNIFGKVLKEMHQEFDELTKKLAEEMTPEEGIEVLKMIDKHRNKMSVIDELIS